MPGLNENPVETCNRKVNGAGIWRIGRSKRGRWRREDRKDSQETLIQGEEKSLQTTGRRSARKK